MKIGEFKSPKLTKAIEQILDTFSGADSGVSFVLFCNFLRNLDEQAVKGDDSAQKIIDMVLKFERLIKVAKGKENR